MKSYDHIKLKVQEVQPAQAALWLESNTGNRKVKAPHVLELATDIKEGRWQLNGAPVIISASGRLLDGQHRLLAICRANQPAPLVIVEGVDDACFSSIDCGVRRLFRDILFIEEEKYPDKLASAVDWLINLKQCAIKAASKKNYQERLVLFNEHPGLRDSLSAIAQHNPSFQGLVVPVSMLTALHYLFQAQDKQLADKCLRTLLLGEVTERNFHTLREHLIRTRVGTAKLPQWDIAARVVKVWNSTRAGEAVGVIRWIASQEEFPRIA